MILIPSPFPILERLKALNDKTKLFSRLEVAASSDAILDGTHTENALFVLLDKVVADESSSGRNTIYFNAEAILVTHFINTPADQMLSSRLTLVEWLHGWTPPEASKGLGYFSARLLFSEENHCLFEDRFRFQVVMTPNASSEANLEDFLRVHSESLLLPEGELTEAADLEVSPSSTPTP